MEWKRGHSAIQCKAVRSSIRCEPAARLESSALTHPWGGTAELAAEKGQQPAVPAAWLVGACSKWPLLCLVAAATLLQTSMDAVSPHQACGELGCGGTHSTFWDHPFSAFTHWGAGTDSYPARQNQILYHLGVYRNRIALSGMGLWGVSTDCISKHCSAAEGLSALVWKPARSWQAFGCISNGCCLELRQPRIDRQYFHSGWHLSGSPLRSPSDLSSVPREKQLQEKPRFFQSSHTLNYAWKPIWKLLSGLLMLHQVYLYFSLLITIFI